MINYIFIGGPLDMQTQSTKGDYWLDSMEYDKPSVSSFISAGEFVPFGSSFTTHRYVLKDVNLMGVLRRFYVSESISAAEANKKIGLFIASLVDQYANT